jgi:hypothetical protein
VTEAEWLACTDLTPMLAALQAAGKASDRKLRLFAVACCRRIGFLLSDKRCRKAATAVEVAESFADGLTPEADLAAAREAAQSVFTAHSGTLWLALGGEAAAMATAADIRAKRTEDLCFSQGGGFGEAADAAATAVASCAAASRPGWATSSPAERASILAAGRQAEHVAQCGLLREVFGNPVRPARIEAVWLAWQGGTVVNLAQGIYHEAAFDRLPVLADALEEAGCHDTEILGHLRGPGPHVRGCWVVDLLTGRS